MEKTNGLREGQVEIYIVSPEQPSFLERINYSVGMSKFPHHYLIKTFRQTDEEAGGVGEDRLAVLEELEGEEYTHNGKTGVYKNVGACGGAPREYAIQTTLITSPSGSLIYKGDWDYEKLIGG